MEIVAYILSAVGCVVLGIVFNGKIGDAVASLETKVETGLGKIEAAIKTKL